MSNSCVRTELSPARLRFLYFYALWNSLFCDHYGIVYFVTSIDHFTCKEKFFIVMPKQTGSNIHGAAGSFLAPGNIHGGDIGTAYVGGGGRNVAGFHTGIGPIEGRAGPMDEDGKSIMFTVYFGLCTADP